MECVIFLPTMLQWCQIENQQRPFYVVNRGILNHDYIPQKSFKRFGLWSPNRYEIDLSNEILNIDFGQGSVKIIRGQSWRSKKNICRLGQFEPICPGLAEYV